MPILSSYTQYYTRGSVLSLKIYNVQIRLKHSRTTKQLNFEKTVPGIHLSSSDTGLELVVRRNCSAYIFKILVLAIDSLIE